MQYNPPVNALDANQAYIDANARTGIQGSSPPASSIEFPQREIVNAIAGCGLNPTNTDLTQLLQCIQRIASMWVVDQGFVNTIIINPPKAATAYAPGESYIVKVAATNSGPTTVNLSGLGQRNLMTMTGSPLPAGSIFTNGVALIAYDGLQFQLLTSSQATISEQSLLHFGVDTGATNALVSTVTPGITSYSNGLAAFILAAHNNTGATTVNLSGLGVKNIVSTAGSAIAPGMITAGCLAFIAYDGTAFELLSVFGNIVGGGGGGFAPYFVSVKSSTLASPPASPTTGDTYLIPPGASGAWSALGNQVSQWSGTAWVTLNEPTQTMVGLADIDDFYKRKPDGTWRTIFASVPEAQAGVAWNLAVTPQDLRRYATIQGPLRVPWVAVNSVTTTAPPGSPAVGDIYVIPSGATGAWSGFTNYMTQWDGTQWLFLLPPRRTVVGCMDSDDTQFYTGTGWRSFWASLAEALAGQSTVLGITPADLAYVLSHQASGGDEQIMDLYYYGNF